MTAGLTNGSLLYLLELSSVSMFDGVHEPRVKLTSSKIMWKLRTNPEPGMLFLR